MLTTTSMQANSAMQFRSQLVTSNAYFHRGNDTKMTDKRRLSAGSLGAAIAAAAEEPQAAANQQTGLRLLANACQASQLSSWLRSHAQACLYSIIPHCCAASHASASFYGSL